MAGGGGGGATGTSDICDLPNAPGAEAHYEYFVYQLGVQTIVSLVCVAVLLRQAHPEPIPVLEGWEQSVRFSLPDALDVPAREAARNGPVVVTVSAKPDPNIPIVWHTGDGHEACAPDDPPRACTHVYPRSSNGQRQAGLPRDQYRVTAGITYLGHYTVTIGSVTIADADLGNVQRTVGLPLAVDEAQAINTRD